MIDHHVHLGKDNRTGFSLDPKTLSSRLDFFNIEKAIIFACGSDPKNNITNPYRSSNEVVLKASYQDNRFIPFMFIHPLLDKLDYVEKNERNFFGFKFYPRATDIEYHYGVVCCKRILDLIIESHKPVIFHTGFREGNRIKDLIWILERKKSPVVFAHSGDLIDKDLKMASKYENVFIDISPLATMLERNFFIDLKRRSKGMKELNIKKILKYLENLYSKERIIGGTDTPWCDNLIENGYEKEIDVLRKMKELGFPNKLPLKIIKK